MNAVEAQGAPHFRAIRPSREEQARSSNVVHPQIKEIAGRLVADLPLAPGEHREPCRVHQREGFHACRFSERLGTDREHQLSIAQFSPQVLLRSRRATPRRNEVHGGRFPTKRRKRQTLGGNRAFTYESRPIRWCAVRHIQHEQVTLTHGGAAPPELDARQHQA